MQHPHKEYGDRAIHRKILGRFGLSLCVLSTKHDLNKKDQDTVTTVLCIVGKKLKK